jgi:hypothetical protein
MAARSPNSIASHRTCPLSSDPHVRILSKHTSKRTPKGRTRCQIQKFLHAQNVEGAELTSTRTMDVLMAPRIIRIATGYALRATSNSSPVPTHKSCPYHQQHLSLIQWLETAHRPTRDAVFPDRSRPFIDQLHHIRAEARGGDQVVFRRWFRGGDRPFDYHPPPADPCPFTWQNPDKSARAFARQLILYICNFDTYVDK